jgi:hypothetical protein
MKLGGVLLLLGWAAIVASLVIYAIARFPRWSGGWYWPWDFEAYRRSMARWYAPYTRKEVKLLLVSLAMLAIGTALVCVGASSR